MASGSENFFSTPEGPLRFGSSRALTLLRSMVESETDFMLSVTILSVSNGPHVCNQSFHTPELTMKSVYIVAYRSAKQFCSSMCH